MLILNSHFMFKPALWKLVSALPQASVARSGHSWPHIVDSNMTLCPDYRIACPMCHTLMKYNISTPCLSDPFPTKPILVVAINSEKEQETFCASRSPGVHPVFPTCLPKECSWCANTACLYIPPQLPSPQSILNKFITLKEISSKMHVSSEERIVAWTQILLDIIKSISYRASMKVSNMENTSCRACTYRSFNSNVRQKPSSISNAAPWTTDAYLSVKIFLQSLQHHLWY